MKNNTTFNYDEKILRSGPFQSQSILDVICTLCKKLLFIMLMEDKKMWESCLADVKKDIIYFGDEILSLYNAHNLGIWNPLNIASRSNTYNGRNIISTTT